MTEKVQTVTQAVFEEGEIIVECDNGTFRITLNGPCSLSSLVTEDLGELKEFLRDTLKFIEDNEE